MPASTPRLKHFVGYSASQAGRNHAPVHAGRRELADVLLPPFEMAIREGGARSVMNSYAEIDGVPVATSEELLSGVLRERWGFDGVVVSDYFSVAFLHTMHAVAEDLGDAAALALAAGIDVELPTGDAFTAPLAAAVREGRADEALIDRAVLRVLTQKEELGLLDANFDQPPADDRPRHASSTRGRTSPRRRSRSSCSRTTGRCPSTSRTRARIAVIGPNADSPEALMGCYSFVNHVLAHHPEVPLGLELPSLADALRAELPDAAIDACSRVRCDRR